MPLVNGWSDEELERRANALAALIRRVWRAVARSVAARLRGQPTITAANADQVPLAWNAEIEDQILGLVRETYLDAAGNVLESFNDEQAQLMKLSDEPVERFLQQARNRLRGIGDDVWEAVREQLILGNRDGESVKDLAARVRNVTGVSEPRSLTIARTEIHAAQEAGQHDQALVLDPEGKKEWLATHDSRVRLTHALADGQTVKINESFQVGGSQLRYPGDPLGDPGETINCRCSVAYELSELGDTVDAIMSLTSSGVDTDNNLDMILAMDQSDALTAASAKKWKPDAHPRGTDGKFIKSGALKDFLGQQKPTVTKLFQAITDLDDEDWQKLKPEQQQHIEDQLATLPTANPAVKSKLAKIDKVKATAAHKAQVKQGADATVAKIDKVTAPTTVEPPSTSQVDFVPSAKKAIPATIYKPHTDGEVVAIADDSSIRMIWNDQTKKYDLQDVDPLGTWSTYKSLPKKEAYDNLKNQSYWRQPEHGAQSTSSVDLSSTPPKPSVTPMTQPVTSTPSVLDNSPSFPSNLGLKQGVAIVDYNWPHMQVIGTKYTPDGEEHQRIIWNSYLGGYVVQTKTASGEWVYGGGPSKIAVIKYLRSGDWAIPDDVIKKAAPDVIMFTPGPPTPQSPSITSPTPPLAEWEKELLGLQDSFPTTKDAWKHVWGHAVTVESDDGKFRLTPNELGGANFQWKKSNGTWSPPKYVSENDVESVAGVHTWTVVDESTPDASSTPITSKSKSKSKWWQTGSYNIGDEVTAADAYQFVYDTGDTLVSPDGQMKLFLMGDGEVGFTGKNKSDGQWSSVEVQATEDMVAKKFNTLYPTWTIGTGDSSVSPTSTLSTVNYSPDDEPSWSDVEAEASVGSLVDGQVVAVTDDGQYRVVWSGADSGFEVQPKKNGVWVAGPVYDIDYFNTHNTGLADVTSGWASGWVKPGSPAGQKALAVTPSPAAPSSVVTTPTSPATVKQIMPYQAKQMKKSLGEVKVGYYSKPEKIWAEIVKLQQVYKASDGSDYSPLEIIKALDAQTKTKDPSPFETKMTKWVATYQGAKIVGGKTALGTTTSTITPVTTPTAPAAASVIVPNDVAAIIGQQSDISHLSDVQQQSIFQHFKNQSGTYLTSPEAGIFHALQQTATQHNLTLLQALTVIDEAGAKKVSQPNGKLFEKKIVAWLQTPKGFAKATGKQPPLPVTPTFHAGVTASSMPSFEDSSHFKYDIITTGQALPLWQQFVTAHGTDWTPSQKANLKSYTGGIYYSINEYFNGIKDDISTTHASTAKHAQLGMRPSTVPLLLHRGVGYSGIAGASSHEEIEKMVGQTWKSGGFFSTSVGGKAAFGGSVLIEVEAPPGTPMAWVDHISLNKGENEMLLAAGLSFKIITVKKNAYQTVVRMRVVPEVTP